MKYSILAILLGFWLPTQLLATTTTYGPTADQETLWSIASRLKPSEATSVQQVMFALYRKNPQAFTSKNLNSLKRGSYLHVPTASEVARLSRLQALRSARWHNLVWRLPEQKEKKSISRKKVVATTTTTVMVKSTQHYKNNAAISHALAKKTVPNQVEASSESFAQKYTAQKKVNGALKRNITLLKQQLNNSQAENLVLSHELAKAKAVQVASTSNASIPAMVNATRSGTPSIEVDIARKVQKLSAEVTTLQAVLEEKDNHIRNLRNTLQTASETIKRQQQDNERIYQELQKQPSSTPNNPQSGTNAAPTSDNQTQLKLSGITDSGLPPLPTPTDSVWANKANAATTTDANPTVVSNPATATSNPSAAAKPSGVVAHPAHNSVAKDFNLPTKVEAEQPKPLVHLLERLPAPSRISLGIAVLAALLILGLLWIFFTQKRKPEYLPPPAQETKRYSSER